MKEASLYLSVKGKSLVFETKKVISQLSIKSIKEFN